MDSCCAITITSFCDMNWFCQKKIFFLKFYSWFPGKSFREKWKFLLCQKNKITTFWSPNWGTVINGLPGLVYSMYSINYCKFGKSAIFSNIKFKFWIMSSWWILGQSLSILFSCFIITCLCWTGLDSWTYDKIQKIQLWHGNPRSASYNLAVFVKW